MPQILCARERAKCSKNLSDLPAICELFTQSDPEFVPNDDAIAQFPQPGPRAVAIALVGIQHRAALRGNPATLSEFFEIGVAANPSAQPR
jgi:hypothetical protein